MLAIFAIIAAAVVIVCAAVATGLALKLRRLQDEHELELIAARQPGRNLETAVWEAYGPGAVEALRKRIDAAPWGSRNRSTLYVNGRLVGTAWSGGWRLATSEERARHDALQDRDSLLIAKVL